jgi:transketolase
MQPREVFAATAARLVDEYPQLALVYAEISGQYWQALQRRHPQRVINVGIREQLLVNVGAGMALTGIRPIVHTFASFLVERAFEQIKLGFNHQNVGGVLVSCGASYDMSASGRTHQCPGDVTLLDSLPDWTICVPGHPAEVAASLERAAAASGRDYIRVSTLRNADAHPISGRFHVLRHGKAATVVAVGPLLDPVLAATSDLDVTVLYANIIRPFDSAGLRAVLRAPDVVLVEPYLRGTSSHLVSEALVDVPHRLLALGVSRQELRKYGRPEQHQAAHGLDPAGLREAIGCFLRHSAGDRRPAALVSTASRGV